MTPTIIINFCGCTAESTLLECIAAWFDECSARDHKKLQSCECDPVHQAEQPLPLHCLHLYFTLPREIIQCNEESFFTPSGRRYKSLKAHAKDSRTASSPLLTDPYMLRMHCRSPNLSRYSLAHVLIYISV